jgi:hypothetical protein
MHNPEEHIDLFSKDVPSPFYMPELHSSQRRQGKEDKSVGPALGNLAICHF